MVLAMIHVCTFILLLWDCHTEQRTGRHCCQWLVFLWHQVTHCACCSNVGPGVGERCDGGSNEEQEGEDTRSNSASDSTGTKRRKSRVRGTIRGARERLAYGRLEQAEVECQDNLVCVEVGEDRKECQPENENGKDVAF